MKVIAADIGWYLGIEYVLVGIYLHRGPRRDYTAAGCSTAMCKNIVVAGAWKWIVLNSNMITIFVRNAAEYQILE